MTRPTKITLTLTAAGIELIAEYGSPEPVVVDTTAEETTGTHLVVRGPGIAKCAATRVRELRAVGGGK